MTNNYERFEQKKVQEVKGSFYVYLPKKWCVKYLDMDQKHVLLKQLDDDSLLINSPLNQTDGLGIPYEIDLDYTNGDLPADEQTNYIDYLFNLCLAAYLIGIKTIIFKKQDRIPITLRNKINGMAHKLHGMVTISETKNSIIIEEHMDNFDIKILIRQLVNRVGLLMSNFVELVEELEKEGTTLDEDEFIATINQLIIQDDQIDEYRYAIERQVHQILRYPTLGITSDVNPMECLHFSEITRMFERIGDYIIKLANVLKDESKKMHDKDFVLYHLRHMMSTYNTIQDYFERTDTYKHFSLVKEFNRYADDIKQGYINEDHPDKHFLVPIRRVNNICADIAEIRINDILARQHFRLNGKNGKSKKKSKK